MVLQIAGGSRREVVAYGLAEEGIELPPGCNGTRFPHHAAHALTAFLTSPFQQAAIVVCGHTIHPEVAVFEAGPQGIRDLTWPWEGPGFSRLYSLLTEALGLVPRKDEHHVEALARQGGSSKQSDRARELFGLAGGRLWLNPELRQRVAEWLAEYSRSAAEHGITKHEPRTAHADGRAAIAAAVQSHLGDLLIEFLRNVRSQVGARTVCLSGGLFYNTNLTTRIREARVFDELFTPIHPGNAGLAVGCALAASPDQEWTKTRPLISPFLGPEYPDGEVKSVLDNCKLSYEFADGGELIRQAVAALADGRLVGWFQGRMEWGPRALGCRSILANPLAPYTLENLNRFLKRRDPPRSYAVSVCEEDLAVWFDGPSPSPLMQFEHRVKTPALFSQITSRPGAQIRVHTVGDEPAALRQLLKAFGAATGTAVLVNTSFNGFHEPIVCSPRDAVRVFYGSGLDMLVIGNFILRK